MLDRVISTDCLRESLLPYITSENERRIKTHLTFLFRILKSSPLMAIQAERLLSEGVDSLNSNTYWLQLEIEAQCLCDQDDVLLRRCLMHFSSVLNSDTQRPSLVKVNSAGIDCLFWFRESKVLGDDIIKALLAWEQNSQLAPSTRLAYAQNALKCLRMITEKSIELKQVLYQDGLSAFDDAARFHIKLETMSVVDQYKITKASLLGVLAVFEPERFQSHKLLLLNDHVDVTDIYYLSPNCIKQLAVINNSPRFRGKKEHKPESIVRRFKSTIATIKTILIKNSSDMEILNSGLDSFKSDDYALLKSVKKYLSLHQFSELILLLGEHWKHPVLKHDYQPNLLPFFYEKLDKYRTIDFLMLAQKSPRLYDEVCQLHQSETLLLAEKNYDIETLRTRFAKLKRLLLNQLTPEQMQIANELGFRCLSLNNNQIQKDLFQKIQSDVQSKKMSLCTGASYFEVIRWVMELTEQKVVEAFRLSFKRYQRHAKRTRIEDLYTDDELRELVFYVEKGLKTSASKRQRLLLFFARIQLKTCWNTSPLSDIELSDITEIELPTAKKAISVLIQKPRKGYDIDCYQLDGHSVRSVMRDILHVRDIITKSIREPDGDPINNHLFIYREKAEIYRIDPINVIKGIDSLLKGYGCSVTYNSMRIRKNGANYIYREVAKDMRKYESHMRHDFATFIKHYQRIDEVDTQQTLHDAVDIMQRYFTGREISSEIKILMIDDASLQKTPTGECASSGNDHEAKQYRKEHKLLQQNNNNQSVWCSDYLACIWCKYFRTVADPEHVWQLLSYRDFVLSDMSASVSDIDNNEFQREAISALHERVNDILVQLEIKNKIAVTQGKQLLKEKGMHPFWSFAVTSATPQGTI